MRSIPEKTLEHWASIYLSNRFPNGAFWWPASGEDVLAELPRLATSGPGKTLALELKTTEADGPNHVLKIDTKQLRRYLDPPSGPPLPVYYVFPLPHWTGPLTSRAGYAPTPPPGMDAPPNWWRKQAEPRWFANWLYVMSAQCLAAALPSRWWRSAKTTMFKLNNPHEPGCLPPWTALFKRTPPTLPMLWTSFWQEVTCGGPPGGVQWHTLSTRSNKPARILVLNRDDERMWQVVANEDGHTWRLLGRDKVNVEAVLTQVSPAPRWARTDAALGDGDGSSDEAGNDRVVLHIPRSGLAGNA